VVIDQHTENITSLQREMISARSAPLDGSMAYNAVMDTTEDHNTEVRRAAREAEFAAAAAEWEKRR